MSSRWVYGTTRTRKVGVASTTYPLVTVSDTFLAIASMASNGDCYYRFGDDTVVATSSDTLIEPGMKQLVEIPLTATHIAVIGTANDTLYFRSREPPPPPTVSGNFFDNTALTLGRSANSEGDSPAGGRWFAYSETVPADLSGVWDMENPTINLSDGTNYHIQCIVRARVITTGALYTEDLQFIVRMGSHPDLSDVTGTITGLENETVNTGLVNVNADLLYNDVEHFFGVVAINVPHGVRIEISDVVFTPFVVVLDPWDKIPVASQRTFSVNDYLMPTDIAVLGTPLLIPPGETTINVKLTYNGLLNNEITCSASVYLEVTTWRNLVGFAVSDIVVPSRYHWWRPGDDVDLWIPITITNPSSTTGHSFEVNFYVQGLHAVHPGVVFVVDPAGVHQDLPSTMPVHRAPLELDLSPATPAAEADLETMTWSDTGYAGNASSGTPVWRSRLSHGYTQNTGNVGLYVNEHAFPSIAITPFSLETDTNARPYLKLHSARFPAPVTYLGTSYQFQSVLMSTQRLSAWKDKFGVWELQAVTPKQSGAWSAFWVIGITDSGTSQWPPEIDFFEHFNGVYSGGLGTYNQYETTSTQHAGIHGSNVRQKVVGTGTFMNKFGFATDWNMWTQIHSYQCVVTEEWITHFVDGIETLQYKNLQARADGSTDWGWYAMLQIQVSADASNPFNDGSSDMLCYGVRRYDEDSGYTLTPFTDSPPWANRKILPDPDAISALGVSFAGVGTMSVLFAGVFFFDNFNRADGIINATGIPWVRTVGTPQRLLISNNMIAHVGINPESIYLSPDYGVTDHYVEVTIKNVSVACQGQVLCRADRGTGSQNWIGFRIMTGVVQVWKAVGTVYTALTGTFTVVVDDVVRMEVIGTTITVKKNGATMLTHTVADAVLQFLTNTGLRPAGSVIADPWLDDYRSGPL